MSGALLDALVARAEVRARFEENDDLNENDDASIDRTQLRGEYDAQLSDKLVASLSAIAQTFDKYKFVKMKIFLSL
jgi:hypothetical protein